MKRFVSKFVLFLIIAIACTLLFEVACRTLKIPKLSRSKIAAKGQALIPKIDNNSVVLLGDSRIEWGLKTQELDNADGNVLNLAFPGSNGLDILQYLLKKKIYPKTILIGFTPNSSRYKNHNFDKLEPSILDRFKEVFKYELKQRFYLFDFESIKLFLNGKQPFFTSHIYDDYGNVVVEESGDFIERSKAQLIWYSVWFDEYNETGYDNYVLQLDDIVRKFSAKSTVYGLYMPVSDTLFSLEKVHYDSTKISSIFGNYLDFSEFNPKNDSLIYYDGSHLNHRYYIEFTKKLNRIIEEYEHSAKNKPLKRAFVQKEQSKPNQV